MKEYAVLFANGVFPSNEVLKKVLLNASITACTDGAANKLLERNLIPDAVIGDLDSLTSDTRSLLQGKSDIVHRPCQESTDLNKAIDYLLERKLKNILITGIKGGRLDHSITNMSVLYKRSSEANLTIFDDDGCGKFFGSSQHPTKLWLPLSPVSSTVSLIAFAETNGIHTQGFKYGLEGESLAWGIRDGQSNQISESPASIVIQSGRLFVFICQKRWHDLNDDPQAFFVLD